MGVPQPIYDSTKESRAAPQGRRYSASDTAQGRIRTGNYTLASSPAQPPHSEGPIFPIITSYKSLSDPVRRDQSPRLFLRLKVASLTFTLVRMCRSRLGHQLTVQQVTSELTVIGLCTRFKCSFMVQTLWPESQITSFAAAHSRVPSPCLQAGIRRRRDRPLRELFQSPPIITCWAGDSGLQRSITRRMSSCTAVCFEPLSARYWCTFPSSSGT